MSLLKANNANNLSETTAADAQLVGEVADLSVDQAQPEATGSKLFTRGEQGQHTVRLVLNNGFTGKELKEGTVVNLSKYMGGGDSNVIVNSLATTAINSNVPASVATSANLFNTRDGDAHYANENIKNAAGWLAGDMPSVVNGMQPLLNIMPHEYTRKVSTHYSPESHLEDRLVAKYGKFANSEDLWNGIVPFPGEPYYYVDRNHVALNIIAKNWEQLGINLPAERLREDKWVKVASSVIDKVIGELQSSVIDQMPFTNLSKLSIGFQSLNENLVDDTIYPLTTEFQIKYTIPQVALGETTES